MWDEAFLCVHRVKRPERGLRVDLETGTGLRVEGLSTTAAIMAATLVCITFPISHLALSTHQ